MSLDARIMAKASERYRQDVERRREEFQRRQEEICRAVPRIARIQQSLRSTAAQAVAAAFRKGQDPAAAIEALRGENLQLQRERAELLVAHGYPFDAMEEKPRCPLCGDAGFTDKGPCRCLMAYYTREQNQELSRMLDLGTQSFDTFDFQLYDTDYWKEEDSSPRENMEIVYELCANYAPSFAPRSSHLLMTGAPGLGKTFLSACIAREVSGAGFSVVYDTAAHVFSRFESEKFGRDNPYEEDAGEDVNRFLNCDLLIVDDLGSEMTTALVVSALYQLVNTRLVTGKQTILNTNLSPEELGKRYGAATLSRLEGNYQILTFFGRDIRKKKQNG